MAYQHESDLSGSSDESAGTQWSRRRQINKNQSQSMTLHAQLTMRANNSWHKVTSLPPASHQLVTTPVLEQGTEDQQVLTHTTNGLSHIQTELAKMQGNLDEYHHAQFNLFTQVQHLQTDTEELQQTISHMFTMMRQLHQLH